MKSKFASLTALAWVVSSVGLMAPATLAGGLSAPGLNCSNLSGVWDFRDNACHHSLLGNLGIMSFKQNGCDTITVKRLGKKAVTYTIGDTAYRPGAIHVLNAGPIMLTDIAMLFDLESYYWDARKKGLTFLKLMPTNAYWSVAEFVLRDKDRLQYRGRFNDSSLTLVHSRQCIGQRIEFPDDY